MVAAADSDGERYSPKAGWTAVSIFMLLYALAYLDRQVINLLVDEIGQDLHIDDVQMSTLQGLAFIVAFVLCSLPVGWAVDRYPRRWVVFIGVTLWSLAASSAGLARSYLQLFAARMGVGGGEATLSPAAFSTLSDLFPKDRLAFPMGVFGSGAIAGQAISLVGGGLLIGWAHKQGDLFAPVIGLLHPWQLVLLLSGVPGILLAGLVFLISEPKRAPGTTAAKAPGSAAGVIAQLRSQPGFYAYHFAGFCIFGAVAGGWNAWAPTLLARTLHWQIPKVGLVLGVLGLIGGVAGMIGSGSLADWLFRRGCRDAHMRLYAVGAFIVAGFGVTVALSPIVWLKCLLIVPMMGIHAFMAVAATSLQIVTPARMRGQMSTIFLFLYNIITYGLGPFSIAAFTEYVFHDKAKIAYGVACHFVLLAPLAGLCFIFGLRYMRRAVAAAEGAEL